MLPCFFGKVDLDSIRFVVFCDAAWANNSDGKSQGGYMVGVTTEGLRGGREGPFFPVQWESYRIKRRCSSTLAAEAMSMNKAVSEMEYVQAQFNEMINPEFELRAFLREKGPSRKGMIVTDCKSLYDVLENGHGVPKCKRTGLEILCLRESQVECEHTFHWVCSEEMLSDTLTKVGADVYSLFRVLGESKTKLKEVSVELGLRRVGRDNIRMKRQLGQ